MIEHGYVKVEGLKVNYAFAGRVATG